MIPALEGYLAAVEETLGADDRLADADAELVSVADLVERAGELALVLDDASVPARARRAVLDDLLEGRVLPEVRNLVHQAVTVVPAGELIASLHGLASRLRFVAERSSAAGGPSAAEEPLGRMGSLNRVSGYAVAVFETVTTPELEEIEDQLFRFARTVEANRALRRALGDRDLPVGVRQQVIADLLGDQVLPATRRLAAYAVRGGRGRDVVATLDTLVEDAARARGWRVAKVMAADEIDESHRGELSQVLSRLAGNPVDLQVTVDPQLLGGVVVQVGDLLVDSSARHRLEQLREHIHVSEAAYRTSQGREPSDG